MHETCVCINHYVQFRLATPRPHGSQASESSLGGINWVNCVFPLFTRYHNSGVYQTMSVGPIHDGMYLDQNNTSVTHLLHSSKLPY